MQPIHVPVMPEEVLHYLDPQPAEIIVDATVGAGGHAQLIAEKLGERGRLIGMDIDPGMLALARRRLVGMNVTLVHASFDELAVVLRSLEIEAVDGIVADLGFCSDQLADPQRGLSFLEDGPLDMRLDPSRGQPAVALLRRLPERELAEIFWRYGEERYSRRIAARIADVRRKASLETTGQLAKLVRSCVPRSRGHAIDPATRVFQALRIAVNDELGALERFLALAPEVLKPGGRLVVIGFHSLEDRLVKQALRNKVLWQELTRKPATAQDHEIRNNPRARSAKLRAGRKVMSNE